MGRRHSSQGQGALILSAACTMIVRTKVPAPVNAKRATPAEIASLLPERLAILTIAITAQTASPAHAQIASAHVVTLEGLGALIGAGARIVVTTRLQAVHSPSRRGKTSTTLTE